MKKGCPHSPETRARISDALKRVFQADPSLRQERADARRREWQDPTIRQRRLEGMRSAGSRAAARVAVRSAGLSLLRAHVDYAQGLLEAGRRPVNVVAALRWMFAREEGSQP